MGRGSVHGTTGSLVAGRARVLHVLPQDLNRGAQTYAAQVRDALAEDPTQEHLVVSLFAAPPAALRPDIRLDAPSGLLRRAGLDPRAAFGLRRLIRQLAPAVAVAHGGESLKYVAVAGGARIVYYRVGLSTAEIARPTRTALYRALAGRTARVVGVSSTIREQLETLLSVPADQLATIPNGRNPHVYYPGTPAAGVPLVLFVGQLERGKQPDLFLDVIAALRSRGVSCRASIAGDGPLRAEITEKANNLGVTLLGIRQDVPDLLRSAAVVVMTSESDTEGMPGVLIEAGLSGVPVVSTAAAGVSDVVEGGVTGFVVDPGTAAALADRVAEILADPDRGRAMGAAAHRRCTTHFTIEATARQWHALVEDLITEVD